MNDNINKRIISKCNIEMHRSSDKYTGAVNIAQSPIQLQNLYNDYDPK